LFKHAGKIRNRPPGFLIPGGGACVEAGQAYMDTSSPSAPCISAQSAILFASESDCRAFGVGQVYNWCS